MGKYESKEKTQKKMIQGIGKFLVDGLITLIGVVGVALLGLSDHPNTGEDAYGIGLIVIFLVVEVGTAIHRVILKRRGKKPSPQGEAF